MLAQDVINKAIDAAMGYSAMPEGYTIVHTEEVFADEYDLTRWLVVREDATGRFYRFDYRLNFAMNYAEQGYGAVIEMAAINREVVVYRPIDKTDIDDRIGVPTAQGVYLSKGASVVTLDASGVWRAISPDLDSFDGDVISDPTALFPLSVLYTKAV